MFCCVGKQFYGQAYPTGQPRKKKIVAAWLQHTLRVLSELFQQLAVARALCETYVASQRNLVDCGN